ncbi:toxin-antitoxin system YwqK family antitoxin [Nonlabens antarcticus]|uniref:toxin-antitoxin system YwqK family antitoxin n=1 Tax=Nonlabens antarcticus TaxID=392714 RepID=UPI00189167DE|nr:nicotinic acid mononucleotide adenyltransferase [Nonlabens antarcticus]
MKYVMIIAVMMIGMITFAQKIKPEFVQLKDGIITATYFHENGKVAQTGSFVNNKRDGEWTSYNNKGTKTATALFDSGKKVGKWLIRNGDVLTEVDYQNNQIASVITKTDKNPVVNN